MIIHTKENQLIAEKEIKIMKQLIPYKHIIKLYSAVKRLIADNTYEYLLLMEYCPRSLLHIVHMQQDLNKPFKEESLASLLSQISLALLPLHQLSIAHRDIKLDNVLISNNTQIRLCDFGSCSIKHQIYQDHHEINQEIEIINKQCTEAYRSPELADLYQHKLVNEKVDIWALGYILYFMLFISISRSRFIRYY